MLAIPPAVTMTGPLVAPLGTSATMVVAFQLEGDAVVPLKVTVLVPCVEPKFTPLIVTDVPTCPEAGLRLVIPGLDPTTKMRPLLANPPTVTATGPVVAPVGTGTTIDVAFQLVGVAATSLNVIVLDPCVEPKFVPVMVTEVATFPEIGLRLVMVGAVPTTKAKPLLAMPPTVTATFPVVAPVGTGATMAFTLQLVGAAAIPLNVTELLPWVDPKFDPMMVTDVPAGP